MLKKDLFIKNAFILCGFLLILTLSYFKVFETFELQTLDLRFKIRPLQKINPDIIIIEIAEDSIEKIGRWPFDRKYHALLIKALNEAGANQIIFDVLFSEESPSDGHLIETAKLSQNVYFPYAFRLKVKKKGEITATSYDSLILEELKLVSAGIGHINIVPDIDGKNRKVPIYIKYKDEYYPHLSFTATCDYLNITKDNIKFNPGCSIILSDSIKIPLNSRNEVLINYAGRWEETFKHYSYVDVIGSYLLKEQDEEPLINLSEFKDKVCFVGTTATALHDLQPMPFARRYPGVGVHANIFNAITTNNFLIRSDYLINLAILTFWIALIVFLSKRTSIYRGLLYVIGAILSYIILSFILFVYLGIWIDLFYPVLVGILLYLGLTFYRLIIERHRRELIEKELSLARRIQGSFLPLKAPEKEGLEIASSMEPARQVGGDLYQFINLDEDRFGIMIADVSGKGIPAALFMVKVVTDFKMWAAQLSSSSEVLTKLNDQLVKDAKTGLFVTVSYATIDTKRKKVILSDAGHLPLIWYDSKEKILKEVRPQKGMPAGLLPQVEFSEEEFNVSSGDVLVFYTDGVTEARNRKAHEFGFERLKATIYREHINDAVGILQSIQRQLKTFTYKAPQHDDITLIVVKVG